KVRVGNVVPEPVVTIEPLWRNATSPFEERSDPFSWRTRADKPSEDVMGMRPCHSEPECRLEGSRVRPPIKGVVGPLKNYQEGNEFLPTSVVEQPLDFSMQPTFDGAMLHPNCCE